MTFDKQVEELLKKREEQRESEDFVEADKTRDQILSLGFIVVDTTNGPLVKPLEEQRKVKPSSFLTIFGSGEISPVGRKIHEYILQQLNIKNVEIALISTPAGFQPNIKYVMEEIAEFFEKHLSNFHPKINIVYANTRKDAENPELIKTISSADYLFIGPGSPTYAIKNLKDTLLLKALISLVNAGKSLTCASAAAAAFSEFTLPVYEIYKVGLPLYWETGLNFFKEVYSPLTIIPHLNNREGGKKTDTTYCYMGKPRFKLLYEKLRDKQNVFGIDENTALIINLTRKVQLTQGMGKVVKLEPSEFI